MKLPTHIVTHVGRGGAQHRGHRDLPRRGLERLVDDGTEAVRRVTRTLVERSSDSSDSSCSDDSSSAQCEKPESNNNTLVIVLCAVIPITVALVVCFFLHRRYVKRQRLEDANDPHKSLDFGVDLTPTAKKGHHHHHHHHLKGGKPGVPEMTITDLGGASERPSGRSHGMSMDLGSPYLLPSGLQGSRESLHSMSRSLHDEHDPYRPITMMRSSSESKRPPNDASSMYSASTMHSASHDKANLLHNAQRMSRTDPLGPADALSPADSKPDDDLPARPLHSNNRLSMFPSRKASLGSADAPLPNIAEAAPPPPQKQSLPTSSQALQMPPPRTTSASASASAAPPPPRKSSASAGTQATTTTSTYDEPAVPMPSAPVVHEPQDEGYDVDPSMIETGRFSLEIPNPSQQYPAQAATQRLSVMGLRPLPPDVPEDNAEVRANRIRSFYKEYFDDSRPNPSNGHYEEDYDASYMDGAIYDPDTGGFVMAGRPYAEAPGRRAMTPPARGAPFGNMAHGRHYSTLSATRGAFRGNGPPVPKKKLPPPKPLQGLPTPYKLKDFDSVISSPIDFAPPTSMRMLQNGSRPDSPLGVARPFSPTVRPFTPLSPSHSELNVLPSPHQLRKSSTFTSLDFLPPSRVRDAEFAGSDAGSIRSARSGISPVQLDAVRAGAYRVSRIPKEMVTTRDDLANQLRPKMDLISRA